MTMPLPQSIPVLALPTTIDYTSKDYTAFYQSMMAFAQQVFPEWTPSSEGDFGVALVELLSMSLDIMSYYGDRVSQEAYLPTATQRLSLLNIAQLLGYIPSNGSPATGQVTFQTVPGGVATVIPLGTQVATAYTSTTDSPIVYQVSGTNVEGGGSLTCPPNGGTITLPVTQGITYPMVALGVSTGLPGQSFQIPQTSVEDGTISIYVQDESGSALWQQIAYLVDADAEAKAYSLFTDQNDITNITFGDGVNGLVPGIGLTIYATYTIGVGTAGNISAGQVGTIVSNLPGVLIPYLADGVTFNSTAMSGGSDPETNDQIRANAPAAFQAANRAVSPSDFASLALSVPGVLMASATANHSTSVSLYVLGPNYQAPTSALTDTILGYFTGRTLAGVTLSIAAPSLIPVDVGSDVSTVQIQVLPSYSQIAVQNNVITALQALLSPPRQSFGALVTLSDIYTAILAVAGVDWCTVPVFSREDATQTEPNPIQFRPSEIPQPGSFFLSCAGGF
jgi:uncharacterized phage protein gp47/JayE